MRLPSVLAYIVLALVVAVLYGVKRDHKIATGFAAIQPEAEETLVRHRLGVPSRVAASCEAYDTKLTANCDHVLVYRSSFAPARKAYWLVFIDPTGHTTATSREVRR